MRILVVCTGNTCRSPMAAALLRAALRTAGREDVSVESAGLSAYPGAQASVYAIDVLRAYGIDLSGHRARPFSPEMARGAVVLAMTEGHRRRILDLCPDADVRLFAQDRDVPDPFAGSLETYRSTAQMLSCAARALARKL